MSKDLPKIWTLVAASMKRATLHELAGITLALMSVNSGVRADDYPSHPMQMIIPFAAGGPTDIVGRIMAAKMGELLGQQFVVENRAGAGGNIGAVQDQVNGVGVDKAAGRTDVKAYAVAGSHENLVLGTEVADHRRDWAG